MVILARGEKVRHWEIRPGLLVACLAGVSTLALGCLGAATLFFLSDDVATAFHAREGRTVAAYEQRIASLRQQVDGLKTRQYLDRDVVRNEVARLVDEQAALNERFSQLAPLLDEARTNGILGRDVPVPSARPEPFDDLANAYAPAQPRPADARFGQFGDALESDADGISPVTASSLEIGSLEYESLADDVLPSIALALRDAGERQSAEVARLTTVASQRTDSIERTLERSGIDLPPGTASDLGGPFVAYEESAYPGDLARLSEALGTLDAVRSATQTLPLAHPLESGVQTSVFGVRADPFLGRKALHTGLDFAAPTGTLVEATAPGTVVSAGANGGYGQMVEVEHGNSFVTRYAHLSHIAVSVGDAVAIGTIVGAVGSTGRSTGPHLHYEIRQGASAIDPQRFLAAGTELELLL